jgi:hypothetical protein
MASAKVFNREKVSALRARARNCRTTVVGLAALAFLAPSAALAARPPASRILAAHEAASFATSAARNCYFLDTAGGAYTVTLDAAPAEGEIVEVWDATGHATANPVSFDGNGNTIAGDARVSHLIAVNFGHARLVFDGSQWLAQ